MLSLTYDEYKRRLENRLLALLLTTDHIDTRCHLGFFSSVAKGNVVEIGTDVGNSTTAFLYGAAKHNGHVYSIDIRDCSGAHKDNPWWTFIQGNTLNEHERIKQHLPSQGDVDVLYIDGGHEYLEVLSDFVLFSPLVKKGGLVLFHDVQHPHFPGTARAFFEVGGREIRPESWGLGVIHV
jgi:predicted O-methyltransferase YrrM